MKSEKRRKIMLEKKQETTQELYNRVKAKRYKILRHIAMEIRVADEVIKECGVREGNIIGQQTAAATCVIRSHKLIDSNKDVKSKAEVLKDISNAAEVRKAV
jgi:hypothetical protein|tara:strand:- start:207 stop:512 length:306 start_codon:yes stop_codon:yes gene_type:complete